VPLAPLPLAKPAMSITANRAKEIDSSSTKTYRRGKREEGDVFVCQIVVVVFFFSVVVCYHREESL
jgi:hypothetical protein